jgi:hypothetical protein
MKKIAHVFVARPALLMSAILLSFGLMVLPLQASANDFDEDLVLEEWMLTPFEFESDLPESELALEEWMLTPFEIEVDFSESEIHMEDWMVTPFHADFPEVEAPRKVETDVALVDQKNVPMDADVAESELPLETWMIESWF